MSDRNGSQRESGWLAELDFTPSRGAPPGTAERVRQRLHRSVAGLGEASSPRSIAAVSPRGWRAKKRRAPAVQSMLLASAAVLLVGGVAAAIRAVIVLRAPNRAADPPALAAAPHPAVKSKRRTAPAPAFDPSSFPAMDPPTFPREDATVAPPEVAERRPIDARHQAPPSVGARPAPVAKAVDTPMAEAPAPSSSSSTLMAERNLLDRARAELGAGHYVKAMQALQAHGLSFSSGLLEEEREALAVRTLAAEGRRDEARERAARFQRSFPHSLFSPAVANAIRAIP